MFTDLAPVSWEFRAIDKFTNLPFLRNPPLQVPSLPISLYRSLPIGRWKKKSEPGQPRKSFPEKKHKNFKKLLH